MTKSLLYPTSYDPKGPSLCIICSPCSSKTPRIVWFQGHWTGYFQCVENSPLPISILLNFWPIQVFTHLFSEAFSSNVLQKPAPTPGPEPCMSLPFHPYLLPAHFFACLSFYLTVIQALYYPKEYMQKRLKWFDSGTKQNIKQL